MADEPPSLDYVDDIVLTRYASAADGSGRFENTISLRDIVCIVIERIDYPEGPIVHWFLQHRDGWTFHFNDTFRDSARVTAWLQSRFQFALPAVDTIAGAGGEGTVVWRADAIEG